MEPSGLPPATGDSTAVAGGARRLAIVLAGVLAVAAAAVAVAVVLLGPGTSWMFLGMVAGLLVGFVAGLGRTLYFLRTPGAAAGGGLRAWRPAEGPRTWVAGRGWDAEQAGDEQYLAQEIQDRWRHAAEGAGLGRLVTTPGGYWIRVPMVLRVQLRPFTRLTIRLWPGQVAGDIAAVEERLCALMRAKGIRVEHVAADVISVDLWGGAHGPRLPIHDLA